MYVIKSADDKLQELEPKKQTESRGVYVVRTSEEVINKFSDIVYEFVDNGGLFILVGNDKVFYQTFKRSVVFELGIESDFIQVVHEPDKAMPKIDKFIKDGLTPFVLMEHSVDGKSYTQLLSTIKKEHPKTPVIVLTREVDKNHLLHFFEEGADHVLNQSSSVNEIIRKLVHILQPQTEIDELVNAGTKLNQDNRFEDAIKIARTILTKRLKSPRAHIIMGDAYKGLAKRKAAMEEYLKAEKLSSSFIDPLKRIFMIHAEDNEKEGMLDYLVKLDDLSPLNFNRKVKIGDLNYEMGKFPEAEQYYDTAINSAASEAPSIVGEMSLDIAEKLSITNPELATKYFKKSLVLITESKDLASMNTFNRLGISLRKAGLWEDAVEAYIVAEKISPGDENIQYNMGLAYFEGKAYTAAAKRMFLALKINPKLYADRPDVAFNIGEVFDKSGDKPQADRLLRHVLEMDPKHKGALGLMKARTA